MKKNIFKVVICVLVLATFICAFAVMASAQIYTGPIYISACATDFTPTVGASTAKIPAHNRSATVYLKEGVLEKGEDGNFKTELLPSNAYSLFNPNNYAIQTAADESDPTKYLYATALYAANKDTEYYTAPGRQLEESGLTFSYDSDTKVMTISGKIKKDAAGKDVPWVLPNPTKDPEVDNDAMTAYSMTKVIIEEGTGITRLHHHCFNAFSAITTVVIPTTVNWTECESFGRMAALKTVKVQGSEFDTGIDLRGITQKFDAQTFHTACASNAVTFYLNDFIASKANTYKADGTLNTKVVTNFVDAGKVQTYTVYTPTGEPCDFARDLEMGRGTWKLVDGEYSVADATKAPKLTVSVRPYAVCGVKALGYRVRTAGYNGLRAEFVSGAADAKMYKVVDAGAVLKTPTETPISGGEGNLVEFGVIVATAANADKMTLTKSGDEYVTGNAKVKKIAAEESKVDKDGKFFVTVTDFDGKDQMNTKICYLGYEIYDTGKVVYAPALAPVSIGDVTIGSYAAGLINKSVETDDVFAEVLEACKSEITLNEENIGAVTYTYTLKDGDLVDGNGVHVSVYLMSDGKYMGVVHTGKDTTKAEFKGGSYSAGAPTWKVYNFLDEMYIGVNLDTIVIDSDVTSLSGALMRSGTFMRKVIYPDGFKFSGQYFNGCKKINVVMPFSKCDTDTDWDALAGTLDMSKCTFDQPDWNFAQAYTVKTIILPLQSFSKNIGAGFFGEITALESVYPDGGEALGNKTIDLRGTGFKLNLTDAGEGQFSTTTEIFKNIWKGIKVIQTEGDVTYMYTCTAAANNSAKPWVFTRTVYGE